MNRNYINFLCAKYALVALLVFLIFVPIVSFGENLIYVVPCYFPFDVSKKDSALDEVFEVKEYRNYIFGIQFEYDNKDINRILNLIGDGKFKAYIKESADTDHPIEPTVNNIGEAVRLQDGLRSGAYVKRPTDFSGEIPIHIRLYKLDGADINSVAIFDEEIRTLGYFSHGFTKFDAGYFGGFLTKSDGGYFEREITVSSLKPGLYRVQVNTVKEGARFAGIRTRLVVEPRPNERQLTE